MLGQSWTNRRPRRRSVIGSLGLLAVLQAGTLLPIGTAQQLPLPTADASGRIAQAIADLGSPSYAKRDKASQDLWLAGITAQSALEKAAAQSDDLETVHRAEQILFSFHLGIYPDTPPQVAAQIKAFHLGNYYVKQRIAQELRTSGKTDLLRRLIEAEPNRQTRDLLARIFLPQAIGGAETTTAPAARWRPAMTAPDIGLEVRTKLAARDFDGAEQLLRGAADDPLVRDYAALLLGRNRLDAAIAQLRATLKTDDLAGQRRLAFFLRAKGDLTAAVVAAKAAKDDKLVENLLVEACDWKELARLNAKADLATLTTAANAPRALEKILAFRSLAGDKQASDEAADALIKALKQRGFQNNKLLEALILNDRTEQLIACGAKESPRVAFELLSAQFRMKDAFHAAKIDVPITAKINWTDWLKDGKAEVTLERRFLAHHVLRALYALGEEDRARDLAAALVLLIDKHTSLEWQFEGLFLLQVETAAGRTKESDDLAAKLLTPGLGTQEQVIPSLYRGQSTVAMMLWKALRKQFPAEDRRAALGHLRRLMAAHPDAKSVEDLNRLIVRFDAELAGGDDPFAGPNSASRVEKLLALATLFHQCGQGKQALGYLNRIDTAIAALSALIGQGDLYADEKHWTEAVKSYEAARVKDRTSAAALYLLGWARTQNGQEAEGRKQMELALMLPLADGQIRHELARTLARLHQDDEAARQRQLVLRLAEFHDVSIVQSLDEIGESSADKPDTAGTAAAWQRLAVEYQLTPGVFMIENRVYLQWRVAAHRSAACELLHAGKTAAAIDELHRAEAIMPQDDEVLLECDAALRKQGAAAEADALYRRITGRLEENCRDFPRCGTSYNDRAWLSANLDRDLDRALADAQRAVELEPKSPGVLDTLAEVHFRRGNKSEAVKLARRCVEMAGEGKHYQEQLARFEK